MGVHGLTTYLKENKRSLSHTLELKSKHISSDGPPSRPDGQSAGINLVVDGWSLLYAVFNTCGEPWVYGGENASLVRHVENLVSAWIRVGLRPTFVFDGPTPPLKYPTLISRLQNNRVKPANLFFRTSATARSTPRSLAETRIPPPLAYPAIVSALLNMSDEVNVELADGEADPYIVSLAGRLGAYVAGNDSDFIVLNCEGYKGYIPLEDLTWITSVETKGVQSPDTSSLVDDDGFEFQTVGKKKQKGKGKLKAKELHLELIPGLIPPLSAHPDLALSLTVYEPATFANHLSLPPSLLPLLGALIGNDYATFEFFRSSESVVQRVQRVADTLSSVLKEVQSGNARKIRKINRGGQGSVVDVIGTTVERILLWRDPVYPPATGQIDKITERVVQSTLEYAMGGPVLLQDEDNDGSETVDLQDHGLDDATEQVRHLYLDAYHQGIFHPRLIEVFARGSCFPAMFLEDPDRECCARSIGRPIREVIWSIFSDGGGIPEKFEPIEEETEQIQSDLTDDEDELVDVVEDLSDDEISVEENEDDPLAALRGKLQRLSFSGAGVEAPDIPDPSRLETQSHTPTSGVEVPKLPPRRKVVTEYLRRGARVAAEELEVTTLDELFPEGPKSTISVQLRPVEHRLRLFLNVLGSDTQGIRELAAQESERKPHVLCGGQLLLVVTLRWVLKTLHARAENVEEGARKRERNKEKWTRSEAQAFLACLLDEDDGKDLPPIDERAVQLTAQVLAAFEACGWLAQALLLVDLCNSRGPDEPCLPVLMGRAETLFSGRKFHTALARRRRDFGEVFCKLWSAVEEGMEDTFGEEKGRKGKKERKGKGDMVGHNSNASRMGVGMFGVLAEVE